MLAAQVVEVDGGQSTVDISDLELVVKTLRLLILAVGMCFARYTQSGAVDPIHR